MKLILFAAMLQFLCSGVLCQSSIKTNFFRCGYEHSVLAEAGGGFLVALKYEASIIPVNYPQRTFIMNGGIGVDSRLGIYFPLEIGFLKGKKHCFEMTFGNIITDPVYLVKIGYRYRGINGLILKVSPIIYFVAGEGKYPSISCGAGYRF